MYKLAQIFFSHFSDPFDSTANTSHSQSVLQNNLHGSVVSFFDKTSINQIRRKREKMDRNLLLIITLFVLYTISSKNYSIIIFCYKTKNRREPKKVKRKKRAETSIEPRKILLHTEPHNNMFNRSVNANRIYKKNILYMHTTNTLLSIFVYW